MEQNRKGNGGLIFFVFLLLLICAGMGAFIYINKDKLISNESTETTVKDDKDIKNEKCRDRLNNINKRLYSLNSEMNKQRYLLLIDDMEYGVGQDFLLKRTYILDLDMTDGSTAIKQVNLASVMKPIVEDYINNNAAGKTGCKIEYMNPGDTLQIDFEKEVAFKGYYHCFENGTETSLGSVLYAYDVENKSIRDMGAIQ